MGLGPICANCVVSMTANITMLDCTVLNLAGCQAYTES